VPSRAFAYLFGDGERRCLVLLEPRGDEPALPQGHLLGRRPLGGLLAPPRVVPLQPHAAAAPCAIELGQLVEPADARDAAASGADAAQTSGRTAQL